MNDPAAAHIADYMEVEQLVCSWADKLRSQQAPALPFIADFLGALGKQIQQLGGSPKRCS
jgi:hypothetical protein